MDGQDDPVVNVLPIHFSNTREPYLQIHQFPLLNRPLQTPPSAALSGKRIRARIKPNARRLEIHVPADTREGFWNSEKGRDHGAGRIDDDRDKNQELHKGKQREGEEPRLGEVRMRSEHIPQKGSYMLGVVRNGNCHSVKCAAPTYVLCNRPVAFTSSHGNTSNATYSHIFRCYISQKQT